jgi:hypothetical protein
MDEPGRYERHLPRTFPLVTGLLRRRKATGRCAHDRVCVRTDGGRSASTEEHQMSTALTQYVAVVLSRHLEESARQDRRTSQPRGPRRALTTR